MFTFVQIIVTILKSDNINTVRVQSVCMCTCKLAGSSNNRRWMICDMIDMIGNNY